MTRANQIWIVIATAVILTAIVASISCWITKGYLRGHPYFFDSASYLQYNVNLYRRVQSEGRIHLAISEYLNNAKHPLRTIPLVLFAPNLLGERFGFIATAVPALFIFLALLGTTILRHTRSLAYATATMLMFCGLPGLYHPTLGMGAYWLDMPAAFFVASAAICLLQGRRYPPLKSLIWFAVFAACACLCRYIAAVFVFVVCGPLLAHCLYQRWRRTRRVWNSVLLPSLLVAGVIAVLSGYHLVAHFEAARSYYAPWQDYPGFFKTFRFVAACIVNSVHAPQLCVLIGVALASLLFYNISARQEQQRWMVYLGFKPYVAALGCNPPHEAADSPDKGGFRWRMGANLTHFIDFKWVVMALWLPLSMILYLSQAQHIVGAPHLIFYVPPALRFCLPDDIF